jgi:hypothetical protein
MAIEFAKVTRALDALDENIVRLEQAVIQVLRALAQNPPLPAYRRLSKNSDMSRNPLADSSTEEIR